MALITAEMYLCWNTISEVLSFCSMFGTIRNKFERDMFLLILGTVNLLIIWLTIWSSSRSSSMGKSFLLNSLWSSNEGRVFCWRGWLCSRLCYNERIKSRSDICFFCWISPVWYSVSFSWLKPPNSRRSEERISFLWSCREVKFP